MKRVLCFFWFLIGFIFFCSCSRDAAGEGEATAGGKSTSLSLVSWNVQTFFDGETDGNEYEDFQSAGKWSKDKYLVRLKRLCEVLQTLNADVYVLEEIENEAVLYDISNQLAGNEWNQKQKWHYACFAKDEGASIGCAVISRFPLCDVKTHCMDIRCQREKQPSVRPVVQVTVCVDDLDLQVFAVHWKSKVGDELSTEIWRDWQEALVAKQLMESGAGACVICGDFNRDANDFVLCFDGNKKSANTVFRTFSENGSETVKVYNPWFDSDGNFSTDLGSYFFEGKWERIDQIVSFGNVKLSSFSPKAEVPWANDNNIPVGYKIYTGEGYSDHLPIMCTLVLGN